MVGMASRPNEGMRKGEIVDFRKAAAAVHSALEEAEKMSGTTVDEVYLAQTGSHLKGHMLRGGASSLHLTTVSILLIFSVRPRRQRQAT